jgi:GntR family transcriptional repressor for pyruvate dehydrogenase complex
MPGPVNASADSGQPVRFSRVEQTRTHLYIAEQLRREITLGLLLAGEALPPERELAAMFGVARATVQEAVQVLQSEGLVETRRGRGGGTFVVGPSNDAASRRRLISRVRRNRALIEEAVAYRLELEPAAAAHAASARTAQDLAHLGQILGRAAETADDAVFTSLDTQFHMGVARASHNRFFTEAVEGVRLALQDVILLLPESPLWQQWSLQDHTQIYDALGARDPHAARNAVASHVGQTARSVRALLKAL